MQFILVKKFDYRHALKEIKEKMTYNVILFEKIAPWIIIKKVKNIVQKQKNCVTIEKNIETALL